MRRIVMLHGTTTAVEFTLGRAGRLWRPFTNQRLIHGFLWFLLPQWRYVFLQV